MTAPGHVVIDPATIEGLESATFSSGIRNDIVAVVAAVPAFSSEIDVPQNDPVAPSGRYLVNTARRAAKFTVVHLARRSRCGGQRGSGQRLVLRGRRDRKFLRSLSLLLANFGTQTSNVEIDYLFDDGSTLMKQYDVPAGSRVTVDVANEAPQLASAAVSAIVRSTNSAPVVAERAQWWPHGAWYEGHVSAGVVQAGVEWQIAGAEVGGPHDAQSYLLIANTSTEAASAQVRVVFNGGTTETLSEPIALGARSRTTLSLREAFPNSFNRTFGVVVESLGAAPAPIVAELSTYRNTTGRTASRGSGARARTSSRRACAEHAAC